MTTKKSNVNLVLPAMAIRGIVPLPANEIHTEVGREYSINALNEAMTNYGGNILLVLQKDPNKTTITKSNLHSVGVLANIVKSDLLKNNNKNVIFKIIRRVNIKEFISFDPYISCEYDDLLTIDEEDPLIKPALDQLIKLISPSIANFFYNPQEIEYKIKSGLLEESIVDILAFNLKKSEDKYNRYLNNDSIKQRILNLIYDINTQKNFSNLDKEIEKALKQNLDEAQKEYYLREKIRVIQNELGDKVRQDEDVEDLRKKLNESKMPKYMFDKVKKEIDRYQSMSSQNAESQVIRNYIDFALALPWDNESKDNDDLNNVIELLNKKHYGLENVKERIVEYLAVKMMTQKNPSTILCFAGPPGVGKTSLAISIAEAVNRKFVKQSLGGVRDESEIRGHRRTYLGALPGRILKGMKDAGVVNPVYLLDEIDKMASDYRGDPAAAMLEVLDPEQNKYFSDNYLEEPYDLSKVMFIATANSLENIPAPLRDRLEIIELSSYTEYEKYNICKDYLIKNQIEAHGLKETNISISDDAIYKIIRKYTREAGVRELNRLIATICRKACKLILLDKKNKKVTVTADNLEEFLKKERFSNNEKRVKSQVGIVTGLAYTSFGGDTLDIEVTTYKGKGQIMLTGKLGDVMKESAQAALSYVRTNAKELGIDNIDFSNIDIHVHVPEGAVPKDGPSAGVTLTTAIYSALSNKKVFTNIGMTGEITLRGDVLPIGGLKEKSIAAVRSGLTKIFIPIDNKKDISDIPTEVKEKLEIVPVRHISEILSSVFEK